MYSTWTLASYRPGFRGLKHIRNNQLEILIVESELKALKVWTFEDIWVKAYEIIWDTFES